MIIVRNIQLSLNDTESEAMVRAVKMLKLSSSDIADLGISKVSVDARHKTPKLVYSVALTLHDEKKEKRFEGKEPQISVRRSKKLFIERGSDVLQGRPVVCGAGPAGLFAALLLARNGMRPIILERGPMVEERLKKIDEFTNGGEFDSNANIQFGEGGAGTFSDGKLTTRIGDDLCEYVSKVLIEHGASKEIVVKQKPHIGTDKLRDIIVSIRKEIIDLGGTVLFNTAMTGIVSKNGRIAAVKTEQGTIKCTALIVAIGHSARDTFSHLKNDGMSYECKPFSVGFRAEHLQKSIDEGLYHAAAGHSALPKGEYQLSRHYGNRCVYTFCMCPGGYVVPAASEDDGVVTNGMSFHARNGDNANAAVVISVDGNDFENDPDKAIAFQKQIEKTAYIAGGKSFSAPAETLDSFLEDEGKLNLNGIYPTYSRGVVPFRLSSLFPKELSDLLKKGMIDFGRKIPGYDAPNTVLTGPETRTSCPIRFNRDQTYNSLQISGIYPCGEGAGYAGGIVSAAVDGLRCARALLQKYGRCTE